jgi:hypothetical protein
MKIRSPSNQVRVEEGVVRSVGRETGGQLARKIRIPELYRMPTPDRNCQGCMKARA